MAGKGRLKAKDLRVKSLIGMGRKEAASLI